MPGQRIQVYRTVHRPHVGTAALPSLGKPQYIQLVQRRAQCVAADLQVVAKDHLRREPVTRLVVTVHDHLHKRIVSLFYKCCCHILDLQGFSSYCSAASLLRQNGKFVAQSFCCRSCSTSLLYQSALFLSTGFCALFLAFCVFTAKHFSVIVLFCRISAGAVDFTP